MVPVKPCALTSQGSPEKQANKICVCVGGVGVGGGCMGLGTPNTVTWLRVPW